jgi:hypothetical protein
MSNPRVLASLNGTAVAGRERRVAVRYPGNPDAACHAYAPSAGVYSAWVRDISASGIALLIECEFEPGALLTLELENPEQGVRTVLQASVVHALEVPPGERWMHGCAFERPLTEAELRAFAE